MKKLNLLSKSQMKKILGGGGGIDACSALCNGGFHVNCGDDWINCISIDYGSGGAADGYCSSGSITVRCNEVQIPNPPE